MNRRRRFVLMVTLAMVTVSLAVIYLVWQDTAPDDAALDKPASTSDADRHDLEYSEIIQLPAEDPVQTAREPDRTAEAEHRRKAPKSEEPQPPRAQQQDQERLAQRKPAPVPKPAPESRPRQHVWEVLLENRGEACGYALYTYVIFTRRITEQGLLQASTVERYRALLAAITTSTPQSDEAPSFAPGATNIFYIPAAHKPVSGVFGLEDYDSHVAMRFVSDLHTRLRNDTGQELKDRIARDPGPFLISTLDPQGTDCPVRREPAAGSAPPGILFVDLSTEHPGAMREVVAVYKSYTQEQRVTGIERFSSLKIALLSVLLHVDDSIKMVEMAAAEIIPD